MLSPLLFCIILLSEIFLVRGRVKFSKLISGSRLSVFQLSENYHGKIREGVDDDGIRYQDRSEHLIFQLVFKEESQAEDFFISVRKIPQNYRKIKRKFIETLNVPPELEVELEPIRKIANDKTLVLLTTEDHQRVIGESDEYSEVSIFSTSQFSVVDLSDETRLRLLEQESFLYLKKPEKCHLISQTRYKDDKYNPNNIIFMGCDLHEYFNGINSTEGIPLFYIEYVSHDPTPIQGIVNEKPCPVYETTVKAVFKNEEAMSIISRSFKSHTVISNAEIQFVLYFPSPEDFQTFAQLNAEIKINQWKSYDGVFSHLME